jgi:hypothetical protein
MRDDFRVAVLHQAMPARFQLRPLFEVIKQLAIEDHDDVPLLIGHRLLAIREADNAQPARTPARRRVEKRSLLRPGRDALWHAPFSARFRPERLVAGEINNACDPHIDFY